MNVWPLSPFDGEKTPQKRFKQLAHTANTRKINTSPDNQRRRREIHFSLAEYLS